MKKKCHTLTWHTGNFRIASEADRTVADRLVVVHVALGVRPTVARIHTVPVVARLRLRTIVVCLTTNHNNS